MKEAKIETFGNRSFLNCNHRLDEDIIKELREACSYMPINANWIAQEIIKKKRAEGDKHATFDIEKLRVNLFNETNYSFPSGLIETVFEVLTIFDYKVKMADPIQVPTTKDLERVKSENPELWEHQLQSLEESAIGITRGIFKLPTGSGKTYFGIRLWDLWFRKLCLVLVPNKTIADQWIEEINKFDPTITIGKWYGKSKPKIGKINIMTYAMGYSIMERLEEPKKKYKFGKILFRNAKFILADESHRIGADSKGKPNRAYELLMMFNHLENIYGLSATAQMREDKADIYQVASMGEIIHTVSSYELIEKGILVMPKIEFVMIEPKIFRRKKNGENSLTYYAEKYKKIIEMSHDRNMKAVKKAIEMVITEERRIIMFAKNIHHLSELYRLMEKPIETGKVKVEMTHGDDSERFSKIKKFDEGEIDIMIVTPKLLGEGLNIPEISAIIYLIGEKSTSALAQAIGRGMRQHKEKMDCVIIDFADHTNPFDRNTIARLEYYSEQGYEIDISQCQWLSNFLS